MINNLSELVSELASRKLVEHRHSNVELKQSWAQDVGKKISSNANKIHLPVAWVVIGVSDAGQLVGRDQAWAKKAEDEISGHLNQYLDPFQTCQSVESHEVGGSWIVVVKVSNPGAVVYWNNTAYKSGGTTISPMEPHETMELTVSLPGLNDYSAQKCDGGGDGGLIRRFATRVAKRAADSPLAAIDGIDAEAALMRIGIKGKNTARLLFGDATFRVIHYDGGGVPTRNSTVGPIYRIFDSQFYEDIEAFAHKHHYSRGRIYPARAFQEAIANAVAHAAYFENNGQIMVEAHPDRLCISNLCTRESAYFANRWFSRSRHTVNRLLMETLRLAGHVDELGRGKNLIFSDYIAAGRPAPTVVIERAARYSRWRLILPGGLSDERHVRLLDALRQHYKDEHKALIALALVLWRDKPVEEVRKHIDGESAPIFAEVLADYRGATFYSEKADRIFLARWARLLLHEGVDSKALSEAEEEQLYKIAYEFRMRYYNGDVTPKDMRELGQLGHTSGAKTVCSKLLAKWTTQGKVTKVKNGQYRFTVKAQIADAVPTILERLTTPTPDSSANPNQAPAAVPRVP